MGSWGLQDLRAVGRLHNLTILIFFCCVPAWVICVNARNFQWKLGLKWWLWFLWFFFFFQAVWSINFPKETVSTQMFALLPVRILRLCKRLILPSLWSFNLFLCGTDTPPGAAPCKRWRENGLLYETPNGLHDGWSFCLALCSALPKIHSEV